MNIPRWDGESFCIEQHCTEPATHERPVGVTTDGELITELVCAAHADG